MSRAFCQYAIRETRQGKGEWNIVRRVDGRAMLKDAALGNPEGHIYEVLDTVQHWLEQHDHLLHGFTHDEQAVILRYHLHHLSSEE